ncbi:hypothetical protein [Phreatobacter sp.]|uniref:phospholipase D family protein n=1 Tax=Phreatobacter sp. TaxID=1966341 RepID=UPI003F6E9890
MKLYEHFGKNGFHTCLVTTFGIDFDAYEHIILARARGAGCHNNLLLADSRMMSLALDGNSSLPRHAGKFYTVTGISPGGVFHPKIALQLGKSGGRVIVSSANVTAAGLAGNLEIAGVIECTAEESGERQLIEAAFRYLRRFLDEKDPGIRQQLEWMLARTPWLMEGEQNTGLVTLQDGSRAAFFTGGGLQGIASQFLAAIGEEKPKRIIIVSPYWDQDLAALHHLVDSTAASDAVILIDENRHIFPASALDPKRGISLRTFNWPDAKRFIHAKLIIVQTTQADHVLYGSANCTVAALGNSNFNGTNEEACLYRALPPNAAIENLGIAGYLDSAPLDPSTIPYQPLDDPIPLRDLELRYPGRFICLFDTLTWLPPPSVADASQLEFLSVDGELMAITLQALPSATAGERRYRMSRSEGARPSFARLRYPGGGLSAPGIILVQDELRAAVRDARTRRVDAAIEKLDGETDVGLWLLETINDLEAAEFALRQGTPVKRQVAAPPAGRPENAPTNAPLSYESFIAGRELRADTTLSRDSFSGSNLSYIRSFLNRILALEGLPANTGEESGANVLEKAFDLGDEVADASDALEGGANFDPAPHVPPPPPGDPELEREAQLRAAQLRRANRDQLIAAVANLQKKISSKAQLSTIDLLRLRAMLMVILAAAWDGTSRQTSSLQVLRSSGDADGAWPRLLGRCLFAYFGGNNPPIRRLVIEDYYDQIPDDVLECWAGCLWAIQVLLEIVAHHAEYNTLMAAFNKLGLSIYEHTGLKKDEFFDPRILKTFDALSKRFAEPLKLSPTKINANHKKAIAILQETSAKALQKPK